MEEKRNAYRIQWKSQNIKLKLNKTILKWILEKRGLYGLD
jgi:hypothetical protein